MTLAIEGKPRHWWGSLPDFYTGEVTCVLCGQKAAWDGWDFKCDTDCPPTLFDPSDHDVRCPDFGGSRCPGVHDGTTGATIWHRRYLVDVTKHKGKTVSRGRQVHVFCEKETCDEVIVESPSAARKRRNQR